MTKVLALDYDGVLADLHAAIVPRMNAKHGLNVKVDDIVSWDFWKQRSLNNEFYRMISTLRSEHPQHIPVYQDADVFVLDALEHIYGMGGTAYVLTANPPEQVDYIKRWLAHYGFPRLPVISAWGKTKAEFDWDVLVDDAPREIVNVPEGRHVITPGRPWNKSQLNSWSSVLEGVKQALRA